MSIFESRSRKPKFLADVMLGSLARWLRILGYDTAYDNCIDDDQLLLRCRRENRIALTRDTGLLERRQPDPICFIRSDDLFTQIQEVLDFLGDTVDPERLLSRCLECNTELTPVSSTRARNRVPPYVFRTQKRFKECPGCHRMYWGGTHREDIHRRLRTLRSDHSRQRWPG